MNINSESNFSVSRDNMYVSNKIIYIGIYSHLYMYIYSNSIYQFSLYIPGILGVLFALYKTLESNTFSSFYNEKTEAWTFVVCTCGKQFSSCFYNIYCIFLLASDNCTCKCVERREMVASVLNIILRMGWKRSFFRPLGHHSV